jgi:hypothetical protein
MFDIATDTSGEERSGGERSRRKEFAAEVGAIETGSGSGEPASVSESAPLSATSRAENE